MIGVPSIFKLIRKASANPTFALAAKSPAAVAGIQIGDIIQSIDGVATNDDVVPRIIGPVGSNVTLTLWRTQLQTPPTIFTVTIRRGREPRSAGPAMAMPGISSAGIMRALSKLTAGAPPSQWSSASGTS